MVDRTCPDCDVAMEQVLYSLRAGFSEFLTAYVTVEGDGEDGAAGGSGGLLDRLRGGDRRPVSTVRCPDCGLLRQYA